MKPKFHDMPHVMHLFLSPGEGGEFVGWQGRQLRSSPKHIHYAYTPLLALLFYTGASMLVSFVPYIAMPIPAAYLNALSVQVLQE